MIATGGDDCVIRLWDILLKKERNSIEITKNHEFYNHTAAINGLDFHLMDEIVKKILIFDDFLHYLAR